MSWLNDYAREQQRERDATVAAQREFERRCKEFTSFCALLDWHIQAHVASISSTLGVPLVVTSSPVARYVKSVHPHGHGAIIFFATDATPPSVGIMCWSSSNDPGTTWGDPRTEETRYHTKEASDRTLAFD